MIISLKRKKKQLTGVNEKTLYWDVRRFSLFICRTSPSVALRARRTMDFLKPLPDLHQRKSWDWPVTHCQPGTHTHTPKVNRKLHCWHFFNVHNALLNSEQGKAVTLLLEPKLFILLYSISFEVICTFITHCVLIIVRQCVHGFS